MIRGLCLPSTFLLTPVIQELDLVHQLALAERQDVLGPFGDAFGGGLDPGQAALGREPDQSGDPLDAVLRRARVIAEPGMRSHRHQHVRKPLDQHAEIGLRPVLPDVLEPDAIDTAYVDAVIGAGDRVETGRIDDDVEFVRALAGLECRSA